MSLDWQNVIVLLAVAAAGGYLARVAWQTIRRRKAACSGCPNCPASDQGPPVVGIAPRSPREQHQGE